MRAVSIYRALLLVRVGWLLLEWFLGWDARRHMNSFTLLHPYAALFAHAAAEFAWLVILVGLWFFSSLGTFDICFGSRAFGR